MKKLEGMCQGVLRFWETKEQRQLAWRDSWARGQMEIGPKGTEVIALPELVISD